MRTKSPAEVRMPRIDDFLAEAESAPVLRTRSQILEAALTEAKPGILTLHQKGYNAAHIAERLNAVLPTGHPKISAKAVRELLGMRPITKARDTGTVL